MFWIDPLLLIFAGIIVAVLGKHFFYEGEMEQLWIVGASIFVVVIFLFVSIGMFSNFPLVEQYAQPVFDMVEGEGATGTSFMINGGLFDVVGKTATPGDLSPGWMFSCVFMFATYPGFMWVGVILGRIIFGRKPEHKGLIGIEKALDRENYSLEESPPFIRGKEIEIEEEK